MMYGQIWRLVPNACSPLPSIRAGAGRGSWPAGRPVPLRSPALASAATRGLCRTLAVSAQSASLDAGLKVARVSAFGVGVVYGSVKLGILKIL